jgi:DNA-binding CsgD family transcriptional regulator
MLNFFLIHPNFNALTYVLELLQKQFESPHGYFGYFNGNEDLVIPRDACDVPVRHRKKDWAGLGKNSMKGKKPYVYNKRSDLPDGYGFLKNAMVITLAVEETLVGQIALMDKASDFSSKDRDSLESMAAFLAPVLQIYAEKEFSRKALDMNLNHLKEKNIALNVLLEKREEDKKTITDTILNNLEALVFPYIEQLRTCDRREDILTISDIMETNLKNNIYPLKKSFSSLYRRLTPAEIKVADFIKSGRTSKEIAGILNISTRAVHFHRDNIRKKLAINKAKKNLRTLLLSLS